MFRASAIKLFSASRMTASNVNSVGQNVRWYRVRRPLELGSSKSKLFRVPKPGPGVATQEEAPDLKRLSAIYK